MLEQLNGTVIVHYSERENELISWTKWDEHRESKNKTYGSNQ